MAVKVFCIEDTIFDELYNKWGYEGIGLMHSVLYWVNFYKHPVDLNIIIGKLSLGKRLKRCLNMLQDLGVISVTNGLIHSPILNKRRVRLSQSDYKKWIQLKSLVFIRDNYTCTYCGLVGKNLECDHVLAFSLGGEDSFDNLTTSCRSCNRRKSAKLVSEFKKSFL